jgi:hypothetical protein
MIPNMRSKSNGLIAIDETLLTSSLPLPSNEYETMTRARKGMNAIALQPE